MEIDLSLKRQWRSSDSGGGFDAVSESGGGDMMEWLNLDDETMTELSKLLDPETASFGVPGVKVRFIDDPYAPPVIFMSSSAYVTINGNEESCGSSFSDQDSSVMASIDLGGVAAMVGGWGGNGSGCAWGPDAGEASGWVVEHEEDMGLGNILGSEMDGGDLQGFCIDDRDEDSMWRNFLDELQN